MNAKGNLLSFVCLVFALAIIAGWSASSPKLVRAAVVATPGCLASTDSIAIDLKDHLVNLVNTPSSTDFFTDTILAVYGVTRVPAAQIAIVTDATTCARAANAFSTAVGISDPDRLVHAVKAGIRYLVIDPAYEPTGYMTGITFDSSFTQTIKSFTY